MTMAKDEHRVDSLPVPAPGDSPVSPISGYAATTKVPTPSMRAPGTPHLRRPSPPPRSAWLVQVLIGVSVVLALVVLVQGILLARLDSRVDRLAGDAADSQRSYDRRVGQLEDRTDALTDRLWRSVDPAAVAKHALPATFRVVAGRSSGTAFAVARAPGGGTYLLTNHHVVDELPKHSRTVKLEHEGAHLTASLVKVDAGADVALLKTGESIPVLGMETDQVVPGEPVLVIGAPVGLEDTVTTGVVSKVRPITGRAQEYIQFDAAINPGNSGGPVLNAAGRVVGIATAKAMDAEGIGFALPIGVACDSFDFVC